MSRSRLFLPLAALAATVAACAPSAAWAGRHHSDYTLHVRAEDANGHGVNLSVPWKSSHGGSPFDFTAKATGDDVDTAKLRWAWATLKQLPEGQPVVITTKHDKIKATRRAGFLVLEPQPAAAHDRARIKIPDYIIEATLAHDGRLTDEDLNDLVVARGKINLVKVTSDDGGVNVWIGRTSEDDLD